jgi:cellulose biosynthesis protein BcsQ
MPTLLIDVDNLFNYTRTLDNGDVITQTLKNYLLNNQAVSEPLAEKQKLLHAIQQRFISIPSNINLADELIAERRENAKREII